MKYTIILLTSLFLLVGNTATAQKKNKSLDQFTVMVEGLGCPYCAFGLEKKLNSLKSINDLTIDIETGKVNFSYPKGDALSVKEVVKLVDKAGYTAVSIEVLRSNGKKESEEFKKTKKK